MSPARVCWEMLVSPQLSPRAAQRSSPRPMPTSISASTACCATWPRSPRLTAHALTAYRRGACRYCHGIEHHFQWKTPREFSEAVELHMLKSEAYQAQPPPRPKWKAATATASPQHPQPGLPRMRRPGHRLHRLRRHQQHDCHAETRIVFEWGQGDKERHPGI